jgi:hypothetical protein
LISYDSGVTSATILEYLQSWISKAGAFLKNEIDIDLAKPGFRLKVSGIWVECEDIRINLAVDKKYYLKYLTPTEYSQIRDHQRDTALPLRLKVSGPSQLDDSFIQVSSADLPVKATFFAVIEEWTDMERAQGKGKPTGTNPFTTEIPTPPFLEPPKRT